MALQTVGVRELRENLRAYLAQAKSGDIVEVTDHGEPVARLVPVPEEQDIIERLKAEGIIDPDSGDGRLDLLPPPVKISGRPLSEILQEMRDEDDR